MSILVSEHTFANVALLAGRRSRLRFEYPIGKDGKDGSDWVASPPPPSSLCVFIYYSMYYNVLANL